jgi:transcriptional regulator with XRE-family HTH domain
MIRRMEALRTWLSESEKTQAELAKALGVSQPTVSDWLKGKFSPNAKKLKAISEYTGLSVDVLLAAPAANKNAA